MHSIKITKVHVKSDYTYCLTPQASSCKSSAVSSACEWSCPACPFAPLAPILIHILQCEYIVLSHELKSSVPICVAMELGS